MARRVLLVYHDDDAARAALVQALPAVKAGRLVTAAEWNALLGQGRTAVAQWLSCQVRRRTCTLVLIGEKSLGDPWINRVIYESWEAWRGVLGIHVHALPDARGRPSRKGSNPFAQFVMDRDPSLSMASVVKTYDPPQADGRKALAYVGKHLAAWVEEAIAARLAY